MADDVTASETPADDTPVDDVAGEVAGDAVAQDTVTGDAGTGDPASTDVATEVAVEVVRRGELTISLNGVEVDAHKGELLIDAAERHGAYIPRFCYHPRMEPVGMCRMCVVEVDTGRGPALQPSCMLECADGMQVDTESPVTKKAQDGILEFLLINHPLDCPVCDKGGECPLQDQTMAYGPGESRYVEPKRHNEKPIPISDLVLLDRERCILCDRCTRFAKDVAGDPLIHFINRGNATEVNTFPDEPFASYFSGNTVQICPVGALLSKPYRFKARPWDLEATESTCQACSVGCRVAVESTRNEVVRYSGVDIDPVNWGWLCDKGRYSFQAVGSDQRLGEPLVRDGGGLRPARWTEALRSAGDALRAALDSHGPDSVGIIGGARLTNEDAYAWAKLAKGVLGTDNVDAQLGDGLPADLVLGLPGATIDEVCRPGGTVVLVGPDVKEELPVLYLRLRHAVVNDGVTVIEVTPAATGFTRHVAASLVHRPGEVAEAVRALVGMPGQSGDAGGIDPTALTAARAALSAADGPVSVIIGRGSVAESADFTADAAGVLRSALPDARFLAAVRRGNARGALDMGLAPGLLPGRTTLAAAGEHFAAEWGKVPPATGLDTAGMLAAAADGRLAVLVLVGADPLADFPDRALARRALAGAGTVIAVDTVLSASSSLAHVVLPAAGFAEVAGTTTNLEGRVSTLNQKVTPPGTARSDWIIATDLARGLGADLGLESVADIQDEIARLAPSHAGLTPAVLGAPSAVDGVLLPLSGMSSAGAGVPLVTFEAPAQVALAAHDAYSLRLVAGRKLYDQGTAVQTSQGIANLAPGATLRINRQDFDRLGVSVGDEVRVTSPQGAFTVPAAPDDALPRGAVGVWFNQPGVCAAELVDAALPVTTVQVETNGAAS
jgi:NADH-quinone oxidoreductase subunit G